MQAACFSESQMSDATVADRKCKTCCEQNRKESTEREHACSQCGKILKVHDFSHSQMSDATSESRKCKTCCDVSKKENQDRKHKCSQCGELLAARAFSKTQLRECVAENRKCESCCEHNRRSSQTKQQGLACSVCGMRRDLKYFSNKQKRLAGNRRSCLECQAKQALAKKGI